MEYGKYIIIDGGGFDQVIIFDNTVSHDTFLPIFNKESILSAGFFAVGAKPSENDEHDIDVSVFGESVTLNKNVRKDKDEFLIKNVLRRGYAF